MDENTFVDFVRNANGLFDNILRDAVNKACSEKNAHLQHELQYHSIYFDSEDPDDFVAWGIKDPKRLFAAIIERCLKPDDWGRWEMSIDNTAISSDRAAIDWRRYLRNAMCLKLIKDHFDPPITIYWYGFMTQVDGIYYVGVIEECRHHDRDGVNLTLSLFKTQSDLFCGSVALGIPLEVYGKGENGGKEEAADMAQVYLKELESTIEEARMGLNGTQTVIQRVGSE